jgi:hypothetical protein
MRAERYTSPDQTMTHTDQQTGWASRIRSISIVEMGRSAAVILNEALIFCLPHLRPLKGPHPRLAFWAKLATF